MGPENFDESLEETMTYKPGPLNETDKSYIRDFQRDEGLKVDGEIGHQTWNTLRDLFRVAKEKLQDADAAIMELQVRLAECCQPDDPGPAHPTPDAGDKWMLIFIGAVVGFAVAAVLFS